jgi:WD40 repeat protein
MITECPRSSEIDRLIGGSLSPTESARLEGHLSTCEPCASEKRRQAAERDLFRRRLEPLRLQASLRDAVLETTERIEESQRGSSSRPGLGIRLWRAIPAAAAALLAIAAIGVLLLRPPSPTPAQKAPSDGKDAQGAPLPSGAAGRLGTLRLRHPSRIRHLAFSPDGKVLASGAMDGKVRFWGLGSGEEKLCLPGCSNGAALSYSADGRKLAIAGMEGVSLWDVRGPKDLVQAAKAETHVNGVAFFPDGNSFVTSSTNHVAAIWDASTGKQILEFSEHRGQLHCLAVSPDGKIVASGEEFSDNTILLWEAASGKVLHKLKGHKGQMITALSFSPDGKMLASSGHDGKILVWDPATGNRLFEVRGHEAVFSPDGTVLAISSGGSQDTKVRIWDVTTKEDRRALAGTLHVTWSTPLAFSRDGKLLAAGDDTSIFLWDVASGRRLFETVDPAGFAQALAFLPGDRALACGYSDGSLRFWDPSSQTEIFPPSSGQGSISWLGLSRDASLLVSAGSAKALHLWDPATGKSLGSVPGVLGWSILAISPDGKRIAVPQSDEKDPNGGTLRMKETASGRELWTRGLENHGLSALSFSPDGRTLAINETTFTGSGWHGSRLQLLDAETGKPVGESESPLPLNSGHRSAFSPDGRILAVCGSTSDQSGLDVSLLDVASGREITTFRWADVSELASMAFSPDGRYLALGEGRRFRWTSSALREGSLIEVREVATGTRAAAFEGHLGVIWSLAFSAGGRRLASGSDDTTVLLWDLLPTASGELLLGDPGRLWEELGSADAARARPVLARLVADGEKSVTLLAERLASTPKTPPELDRFIEDLGSSDTVTHLKAAKRIRSSLDEPGAEETLRRAAEGKVPELTRIRLGEILTFAESPTLVTSAQTLRCLRAIEILERIGGEHAREVLRRTAAAARSRLSREAALALERMSREGGKK